MVLGGNVDRVFWCQNLYIAHFSLLTTFSNTAFFSHTFRSVLIRFPDRGLVLHGRQNLKLFSQLFWLILIPYCCIGLFMAPVKSIIVGSFTDIFSAKICIFSPGFERDSNEDPKFQIPKRQIMLNDVVPMVVPLLNLGYCQYWTYKVRQYFRRNCPNNRMYSFGNYRRNFVTFEQNLKYIQIHFLYVLITNLFLNALFLNGEMLSLNPERIFWVQNLWHFLYFDIYHGIFLPTKMTIQRDSWQRKPFWQKESIPQPRRDEQTFVLNSKEQRKQPEMEITGMSDICI